MNSFFSRFYGPQNDFMINAINCNAPMPTQQFWMKQKIQSYSLFKPGDSEYDSFQNHKRNEQQKEKPRKEYWEKYESKKEIPFDENNVFFSKKGITMLARFGATRKELRENFGHIGVEIADELKLISEEKSPNIEGLQSIFDVKVDPEIEVKRVIESNPAYPPIYRDRKVLHHQEPNVIEMKPHEGKLELDVKTGPKYCDSGSSNACNKDLIDSIFKRKDEFSKFSKSEFIKAREHANPYETIKKACFINRAAVKMANLDCIFNFTSKFDNFRCGIPRLSNDDEPFYFADICAGPGGFTDYLYFRLNGRARGFGMTIKNDGHDWYKRERFITQIPTFDEIYGEAKDGDIFKSGNISFFEERIRMKTGGKMVELVTADGGSEVTTEENYQEQVEKRLVLCQCLTALCILRKGGCFLCKTFDTYTDFTVEVLYLVAQSFEKFCIIKPYTSRPANSERYIIGLGLREAHPPARDFLAKVNDLVEWTDDDIEITSLFDFNEIPQDFVSYVKQTNEELIKQQDQACIDLLTYAYNPDLKVIEQEDIKKRCLEEWNLKPILSLDEKKKYIKNCRDWKPAPKMSDLNSAYPRKDTSKKETRKNCINCISNFSAYLSGQESKNEKKEEAPLRGISFSSFAPKDTSTMLYF